MLYVFSLHVPLQTFIRERGKDNGIGPVSICKSGTSFLVLYVFMCVADHVHTHRYVCVLTGSTRTASMLPGPGEAKMQEALLLLGYQVYQLQPTLLLQAGGNFC